MVSSTILGGFFPWTEIRKVYGEKKNHRNDIRNLEKFQDAYKIQPSIYAHLPRLIITNGCLALLWQMFITEEILSCSKACHVSHLPCYVCRARCKLQLRWGRRVVWMIGEGWKWHAQLANAPTESPAAVLAARKQILILARLRSYTCCLVDTSAHVATPRGSHVPDDREIYRDGLVV